MTGLWKLARQEIAPLARLAVPLAAAQGGQALMGVVDTAVVGRAGALQLAGVGLGNALFVAISVLGMGVMQGLDPLVAQAIGAGDGARARRLLWQGVWLSLLLSAALALPFLAAPRALGPSGIEPGVARALSDDPHVVAVAAPLLRIAGLFQISDGIQAVAAGVLRGAGETRFTFAANVAGHWAVGFPAAVLLAFGAGLGVGGLWWGFVLGLTAVAASLLWRFLRVSSREIVPLAGRTAGVPR